MKPSRLAFFASLAATLMVAVCAGSEMPTIANDYGPSASTPPNSIAPKAPYGTPAATGNATASASSGNTTPPNPALGLPLIGSGNVTVPANGNNTVGNSTVGTAPANGVSPSVGPVTPNLGPDLSSLQMPATMDKNDNEHPLGTHDRFLYQVVQDHDPAVLLTVDSSGNIDVPDLGRFSIVAANGNMTLKEMGYAIQTELTKTDPVTGKQNLYKHATVLARPFTEPPHSEINVLGSVMRVGPIPIAPGSEISLWDVVYAAGAGGGPAAGADLTRVSWIHHDPGDPKADPNHIENLDKMAADGTTNSVMVESGDIVTVPSKADTSGYVFVSGEVNGRCRLALPAGGRLTVAEAILAAGNFSKWASHWVVINRVGKDNKSAPLPEFNVDEVLVKGHHELDIPLQDGDIVFAEQSWLSTW